MYIDAVHNVGHRQLRHVIPEYTLKLAAPSLIYGLLVLTRQQSNLNHNLELPVKCKPLIIRKFDGCFNWAIY